MCCTTRRCIRKRKASDEREQQEDAESSSRGGRTDRGADTNGMWFVDNRKRNRRAGSPGPGRVGRGTAARHRLTDHQRFFCRGSPRRTDWFSGRGSLAFAASAHGRRKFCIIGLHVSNRRPQATRRGPLDGHSVPGALLGLSSVRPGRRVEPKVCLNRAGANPPAVRATRTRRRPNDDECDSAPCFRRRPRWLPRSAGERDARR